MRKFKIPAVPPTTNKSIRFPNDVIEQVEAAIQGKDCTFSAFVVEAVRVALEVWKRNEARPSFFTTAGFDRRGIFRRASGGVFPEF